MNELKPGGIYSIQSGTGTINVAKVLVIEPGCVHIRIYSNAYTERPTTVDIAGLQLGSLDGEGDWGIGHLPITPEEFLSWQPMLVAEASVNEDELDGYHIWQEANGGVWGVPADQVD